MMVKRLLMVLGIVLAVLSVSYGIAWAFAAGVSGKTAGCGGDGCHAPTGPAPTVLISGPTTLAPGSTATYTVAILGGVAGTGGGIDIKTSAGTLSAGTNTQVMNGEITQVSPARTFTFMLAAPPSGSVTLSGAGLAANDDATPQGDNFATTSLTIAVSGTTTTGASTTTSARATTTSTSSTTTTTIAATTSTSNVTSTPRGIGLGIAIVVLILVALIVALFVILSRPGQPPGV